jgi:tetratricopeptide (TPR) repeat protein
MTRMMKPVPWRPPLCRAALVACLCLFPGHTLAAGNAQAPTAPGTAVVASAADAEVAELRQKIATQPTTALYLRLGRLLLRREALPEALAAFDAALQLNPRSHEAKTGKGAILGRMGQGEQAEALLREALANNPDPVWTHYELGRLYEERGESARAIEEYKKGLGRFDEGRK